MKSIFDEIFDEFERFISWCVVCFCHLTLESCVIAKTSPPALRNPGLEWKASLNPITGLYLLASDRNSIGLLEELELLVLLAKRFRVASCNYVCSEASHILLD
jgi:hypothetical protein